MMNEEQKIILRKANGLAISQSTKEGYWNATEMCQAWGKSFGHWVENDSTQEYLNALSLKIGIPINKLVVSLRGRYGGTWVHPLVANRLAQWCSPAFAVTVDEWIEELKHGRYPQAQASDPHVLPILERHEEQIQNLDGRLAAVEGHDGQKREKQRNRKHDRLIRKALRRTGGKCPCGCGPQMLNPDGSFVDGVQIDHWNELRGDNRLANKWPLFQQCHTEKHKREDDFYLAFSNFQRILKIVEQEDTAIIPPSPFAQSVIDKLNNERFGPRGVAKQETMI